MRRLKINVSSDCLRKYLDTNLASPIKKRGEMSNRTENYANAETLTTQVILR